MQPLLRKRCAWFFIILQIFLTSSNFLNFLTCFHSFFLFNIHRWYYCAGPTSRLRVVIVFILNWFYIEFNNWTVPNCVFFVITSTLNPYLNIFNPLQTWEEGYQNEKLLTRFKKSRINPKIAILGIIEIFWDFWGFWDFQESLPHAKSYNGLFWSIKSDNSANETHVKLVIIRIYYVNHSLSNEASQCTMKLR